MPNNNNRPNLKNLLLASMAGAMCLAVLPIAQAQTEPSAAADLWDRPLMTGDWNGARSKLKADGIVINGFYTGEFADAFAGGKRTGSDIASQFGLGTDVDLGALAGLNGAILHFAVNQRVGRSTSADDIGNKMAVQEDYGAGETLRISEMSYEQTFDGKHFDTRIGFYPMGNLYGGTPLLMDFQNTGFCTHPLNLPNSSGWTDYPTGKWGGSIKFLPAASFYMEAGVFDVNPTYSTKANGLKTSLAGSTGALIPLELGYVSALGPAALPGHYKLGGYYDSSAAKDAIDVTAAEDEQESGRYGFYFLADQMVASFDGTPKHGLIGFAIISYSDPRTAVYESTIEGGLVAQGPFAARPADFIAVGYVRAGLNNRAIDAKERASDGSLNALADGEGVVEIGYGLQAAPWLLVHPNLQYITNPGTFAYNNKLKNAWAFCLQAKIVF